MGAPGRCPCTPAGIVELLHAYDVPVSGRHVVIVGRGLTIGRPLALLLALKRPGLQRGRHGRAHRACRTWATTSRQGDIVVAAAGWANLVTRDMVKPGAAVVGAGVSRDGKRLLSDVEESVAEVAGWITPADRRGRPDDAGDAAAQRGACRRAASGGTATRRPRSR